MFTIKTVDLPASLTRTAHAEELLPAFEAAGSLAQYFSCDVLISDEIGSVAKVIWLDEVD